LAEKLKNLRVVKRAARRHFFFDDTSHGGDNGDDCSRDGDNSGTPTN
jgi:hypothetical protein